MIFQFLSKNGVFKIQTFYKKCSGFSRGDKFIRVPPLFFGGPEAFFGGTFWTFLKELRGIKTVWDLSDSNHWRIGKVQNG